jgi:hypothetical protein
MSEFKAQILGVIIILGIFAVLNKTVSGFFQSTWANIQNQVTQLIQTSDVE